ncbi:hypothetical protein L6R21_21155 [bacterium]|nr:hypothetical protein [bacterium]
MKRRNRPVAVTPKFELAAGKTGLPGLSACFFLGRACALKDMQAGNVRKQKQVFRKLPQQLESKIE